MASFSYLFDICNCHFPEGSGGVGAADAGAGPAVQGSCRDQPWVSAAFSSIYFTGSIRGFYLMFDRPKAKWQ